MKRALALLVGGVLILGSALAAHAQAPTVSFGGQMRVYGFAMNNIIDFQDSENGNFRDSNSFYFQRWRLFTNVESADKKAKAVWALEVGDITWGTGGGASGAEYRGCQGEARTVPATVPGPLPGTTTPVTFNTAGVGGTTRVGNGSGGCLGADGVNVETKHAYIWADTGQWLPGSSITIGIQSIVFMGGPLGGFMDDDGAAIKINMKFDPVDIEVYTVKLGEGLNGTAVANGGRANADDADMYVARVGANFGQGMRATLEGMLVDEKSLPGFNIGDTFWVGGTFGAKFGEVQLDAAAVYGQRARGRVPLAGTGSPFDETGFGAFVTARVPVGPVNIFAAGWYTTGDDTVGPAGCGTNTGCDTANYNLSGDSDKLPLPVGGASWFGGGGPYIAEWLFGNSSIGAPGVGQIQYADPTGTWGVGASATYAITPALSVGGGAAYVMVSDDGPCSGTLTGRASCPYGDSLFEIDAGATYRFNPNLVLNLFGGYLIPDTGDNAWAVAFRTQYAF